MNDLTTLKFLAIIYFVPSLFTGIGLGECIRARSIGGLLSHPIATFLCSALELLALRGIAQLAKAANNETAVNLKDVPSLTNQTDDAPINSRLAFLMASIIHLLGAIVGLWLTWAQ